MSADHYVMDSDMKKVANAIRTKGGTTEPLVFPDGMVTAIENIQTGGGETPGKVLIDMIIPTSKIELGPYGDEVWKDQSENHLDSDTMKPILNGLKGYILPSDYNGNDPYSFYGTSDGYGDFSPFLTEIDLSDAEVHPSQIAGISYDQSAGLYFLIKKDGHTGILVIGRIGIGPS